MNPLVSIICLCYNHAHFIEEAIRSVLSQTYSNIQLIIVDDASTDDSATIIHKLIDQHPHVEVLFLKENLGNCKAFNQGLKLAKGDFIVDFATDDVMMPDRITKQVDFFKTLDSSYGVVFTDAIYIDEAGNVLRNHNEYLIRKRLIDEIPQGEIYASVLSTYFISSPTMLSRKEVFASLQGYDEDLAYEDFDFWIRSARNFKYGFLNEKLTKVRQSKRSMSRGWYVPGDKQLHSTFLVCKKARALNRSNEDKLAWVTRVKYELRQSVFSENYVEAELFYNLLKEEKKNDLIDEVLFIINRLHLPLASLRRWYHRIKY
jgi:glycosyltransferase involved in cell wall biosynthesis